MDNIAPVTHEFYVIFMEFFPSSLYKFIYKYILFYSHSICAMSRECKTNKYM